MQFSATELPFIRFKRHVQFTKRLVDVLNRRHPVSLKIMSRLVLQFVLHVLKLPD